MALRVSPTPEEMAPLLQRDPPPSSKELEEDLEAWCKEPSVLFWRQRATRKKAAERIREAFEKELKDLSLPLMLGRLTSLPQSIRLLTHLETLWVSGSRLTELSESIGELTQLKRVYLSDNDLEKLPQSIGSLPVLEVLHIDGNKRLKNLPNGVFLKLKSLIITGTAIKVDDMRSRFPNCCINGELT